MVQMFLKLKELQASADQGELMQKLMLQELMLKQMHLGRMAFVLLSEFEGNRSFQITWLI